MKTAQGKSELLKHRSGKKLTYRQAVLAKCYECMGYYADGKSDCLISDCPLFNFMPYRSKPAKKDSTLLAIAKNGISGE